MTRHNILTPITDFRPERDHVVMTAPQGTDERTDRMLRQGRGVALFGTGQGEGRGDHSLSLRPPRAGLAPSVRLSPVNPSRVWESLSPVTLDDDVLMGNGLFPRADDHPAARAFDLLRTRLLLAMEERSWQRIAVTSPTHGCGKSFVAANLALSLARRPESRTVLMDLELRAPALAGLLGLPGIGAMADFLTGAQPLESHFRRVGRTLALGLNGTATGPASALLHAPGTAEALEAMLDQLCPEIVIHDLPPALAGDDVLAMAPHVDAVLLVADGTRTTAADVKACERLFAGRVPLMGVVLNRAQDRTFARYTYGRR